MKALILLAAVAVGFGSAQRSTPTFSVDVPLISVNVAVTDVEGRLLSTLSREDFLIYEDGSLQQIQQFSPVNVPYNVLFLFDCSGSTRPRQSLMAAAIDRFINKLRPQDTFAIAEFGVSVELRSSWRERGDAGSTKALLGTSAGCSGTDLYGALEWSAGRMQNIQGGRESSFIPTVRRTCI